MMIKNELLSAKKADFTSKSIKILHISDVHAKKNNENLFIWDEIGKLSFDAAAITGDFIQDKHTEALPHLPYLRELTKKVPVFYVFGNHEVCERSEMRELFESAGITVLEDEIAKINISGVFINILGIRDYYLILRHGFGNIFEMLKVLDPNDFNIVLSHQPQVFKYAKSYNVDLMLSGHTHGGQVRLPFFPTLFAPGQGFLPKYGDGWYHENSSNLYISKGVGTTVFPFRIFNQPEISVLEVRF